VQALGFVHDASSVQIEPLSTCDWELMEIYAQELEAGMLLNQVSIVYPGQSFPLTLGRDIVNVCVLKDGFCSVRVVGSMHGSEDDVCLRLVADTEVIVTPKPRAKDPVDDATSYPPSTSIRIVPGEADFSTDMKRLRRLFHDNTCLTNLIPCPPPFTAWMHPNTLSKSVPGWDDVSFSDPDTSLYSFTPSSAHVLLRKSRRNGTKDGVMSVVELVSSEIVPIDCAGT